MWVNESHGWQYGTVTEVSFASVVRDITASRGGYSLGVRCAKGAARELRLSVRELVSVS